MTQPPSQPPRGDEGRERGTSSKQEGGGERGGGQKPHAPSSSRPTPGTAIRAATPGLLLLLLLLIAVIQWRVGAGIHRALPAVATIDHMHSSARAVARWVQYHRSIGVGRFYLFVEGAAARPPALDSYRAMEGVEVVAAREDPEVAARQSSSRIWKEKWLSWFFNKPCNFALFVRQNLNLEEAIRRALLQGQDWILHVDTDELVYPAGTSDFSVRRLLDSVKGHVDAVVLPNYEAAVESEDVADPFTEVTLFKKNFDHVSRAAYFALLRNAARVQPGLRPNGAHRFSNYRKKPRVVKMTEGAVLHYTYARFSDIPARAGRCACNATREGAAQCFILPFDQEVFLLASRGAGEEAMRSWYRKHVVWGDRGLVRRMLRAGLMERIYTPKLLVPRLEG